MRSGGYNIEHRRSSVAGQQQYPSSGGYGGAHSSYGGAPYGQQPTAAMNTDSIRSALFATSNGAPRAGLGAPSQRGGVQLSSSGYGQPRAGVPAPHSNDRMYAEQSERLMESQNDALTARLSDKVSILRQLSIEIGTEVREQNRMLNDMDADMERTQSFMHKTLGNLQNMIKTGGSKHMCYLVLFIFVLFMLVYWLVR